MDQLKMTEEQSRATLRDGQDAAEMLLEIEAKIGELLPEPEEVKRIGGEKTLGLRRGEDLPVTPRLDILLPFPYIQLNIQLIQK